MSPGALRALKCSKPESFNLGTKIFKALRRVKRPKPSETPMMVKIRGWGVGYHRIVSRSRAAMKST